MSKKTVGDGGSVVELGRSWAIYIILRYSPGAEYLYTVLYCTVLYSTYLPGFRLTTPRRLKWPLPIIVIAMSATLDALSSPLLGDTGTLLDVSVHGVQSLCARITNSILASPHGASEQYMYILTSGRMINGCVSSSSFSSPPLVIASSTLFPRLHLCLEAAQSTMSDWALGSRTRRQHSSSRCRLNARMARISAWLSCRIIPLAGGILERGRHFMPVARVMHFNGCGGVDWFPSWSSSTVACGVMRGLGD